MRVAVAPARQSRRACRDSDDVHTRQPPRRPEQAGWVVGGHAGLGEEPLDGAGVDGKGVSQGHALEAGQAVEKPFVGALVRERWRKMQAALVPRQDGVDGLAEHGERRFKGKRIPQERPEQVARQSRLPG